MTQLKAMVGGGVVTTGYGTERNERSTVRVGKALTRWLSPETGGGWTPGTWSIAIPFINSYVRVLPGDLAWRAGLRRV